MTRNNLSVSEVVRAAVGSSKMISRALSERALAISTICCCADESCSEQGPRSNVGGDLSQNCAGLFVQAAAVDEPKAFHRLACGKDVFGHLVRGANRLRS